jgi:surface antigen
VTYPRSIPFRLLIASVFVWSLGLGSVLADPPEWAPAHGWRKKHDRDEDDYDWREHRRREYRRAYREEIRVGYEGRRWPSDYGIARSTCNRDVVGAVLGGVAGGVIGSQIGRGDERVVAVVIGSVVGAVLGAQIGRGMDERDRACLGHALELADAGRSVHWVNEETGAQYLLAPVQDFEHEGRPCRAFALEVTTGHQRDVSHQRACRNRDGVWAMQ